LPVFSVLELLNRGTESVESAERPHVQDMLPKHVTAIRKSKSLPKSYINTEAMHRSFCVV